MFSSCTAAGACTGSLRGKAEIACGFKFHSEWMPLAFSFLIWRDEDPWALNATKSLPQYSAGEAQCHHPVLVCKFCSLTALDNLNHTLWSHCATSLYFSCGATLIKLPPVRWNLFHFSVSCFFWEKKLASFGTSVMKHLFRCPLTAKPSRAQFAWGTRGSTVSQYRNRTIL